MNFLYMNMVIVFMGVSQAYAEFQNSVKLMDEEVSILILYLMRKSR